MSTSHKDSLRIGSLNARGIRGHEKEILNFFYSEKLDILCLQEVMVTSSSNYNFSRMKLPGGIFFADVPHHSLAIYYREGLEVDLLYAVKGVAFFATVTTASQRILVANCYFSPNRADAATRLSSFLSKTQHFGPVVVIGDLNARFAGTFSKVTNRNGKLALELCAHHSLTRAEYSGPSTVKRSAVDHVLYSPSIHCAVHVLSSNVACSDHFPLICEARVGCYGKALPRSRYWKRSRLHSCKEKLRGKLKQKLGKIPIPAKVSNQEGISGIYQ